MANYILNHTGAQIDEGIETALMINNRIGSAGPAGCRNKINNPKFAINQRDVSGTVTLAAGAFGHDRWKAGASGCTYTFSTTDGRTTISISAGSLIQTIEGRDLPAGVNTMCLSWGGTCQGKLGADSYGASGVTGSATGGTNINVEFGAGTLYEPQLERGTVASEFDSLSYQDELDRCFQYLFHVYCGGLYLAPGNFTRLYVPFYLPVKMRAVPTVLSAEYIAWDSSGGTVTTFDAATTTLASKYSGWFAVSKSAGGLGGLQPGTNAWLSAEI